MTDYTEIVERAKKQSAACQVSAAGGVCPEFVCQFATAVVEMAEELTARDLLISELKYRLQAWDDIHAERLHELEAQLAESHESIQTISSVIAKMDVESDRKIAQLATARRLIEEPCYCCRESGCQDGCRCKREEAEQFPEGY